MSGQKITPGCLPRDGRTKNASAIPSLVVIRTMSSLRLRSPLRPAQPASAIAAPTAANWRRDRPRSASERSSAVEVNSSHMVIALLLARRGGDGSVRP